jgi:hypothetical protein
VLVASHYVRMCVYVRRAYSCVLHDSDTLRFVANLVMRDA